MKEHEADKEAVMLLTERVSEAQRAAMQDIKEVQAKKGGKRGEGIHRAGGNGAAGRGASGAGGATGARGQKPYRKREVNDREER